MKHQSPSHELSSALVDGALLLGTATAATPANDLETVLRNRLSAYYNQPSNVERSLNPSNLSKLEDVQLATAKEAIRVVQRIHLILDHQDEESDTRKEETPAEALAIGTRDLGEIRTLLSVVFKWAVEPLFIRIRQEWPTINSKGQALSKIIDLTLEEDSYRLLTGLIMSLFSLIFPQGPQGRISQTLITTTILSVHVKDILLPSLSLGWLPESLSSSSMSPLHEARPFVTRLIKLLTPAQAISSLTSVLSSTSPSPLLHARKACTYFLARQVTRPNGVHGLYEAAFSTDETNGNEAKYEQLSRTLNSVPQGMKPEDYYQQVFPQVVKLLTSAIQPNYKRAAAFTIYRAIVPQKAGQSQTVASATILAMLHGPLLNFSKPSEGNPIDISMMPRGALRATTVLISNTEPSPVFISRMLSPIIPALYVLSYDLDQHKTSDPEVKESVIGLLMSWGKIVDHVEGTDTLWSIIERGKDSNWMFGLEGQIWKTEALQETSEHPFMMPKGSPQMEQEEDDEDLNIFQFFPDPVHFVQFLKELDRGDIGSALLIRLLEFYRDSKGHSDANSMKILHTLQIIMQMQKRLSEGTNSNILRKPDQLLSFIYHIFDAASITVQRGDNASTPSTNQEPYPTTDDIFEGDSDDEDPGSTDADVTGPDDELIETAITLLLSILEADETLTARTHPVFNDIFTKLEPLALKGSTTLRPLARETRLVITARLAQTSNPRGTSHNAKSDETDQETYQKALKLLQDPILPVRAHGLLLLRELVSSSSKKGHSLDKALVPSILSIFLQAVQDEDSYMFLNAVQGLAVLADTFGKDILQGLINDYAGGLEGLGAGNLTQHDLDIRTRIGEALSSVIKHCGTTLSLYVDILVPTLFSTLRRSNVPTALRTSSLSLLADCVDTYAPAVLPYVEDLSQAMIDLLQVEHVPTLNVDPQQRSLETGESLDGNDNLEQSSAPTIDSDPTSKNSKFPLLRRAALHFLSMLIKASLSLIYEEAGVNPNLFPRALFRRVSVTLAYISATDEDNMVRVMARETKEGLEELERAALGL